MSFKYCLFFLFSLEKRPQCSAHKSPFQNGRALFSELGFSSWNQRRQIYQLERNEKVLRELRVLDAQVYFYIHKYYIKCLSTYLK